ncbi:MULTISPECIES: DegT/DnrJ/EryC1/StrS family aminotransferase [unclassified Bradyrhizobium]|uniref:DegT/DnrJ/EryC1/StrS family aminotransferase n=1 Tax=unclassified Bradyrhizobium TaxID=2631580 RepID=UPI0029161ECC|nr:MULTISPECIES: DegT/DnrJ/EryC1/StrS family aminotransferase [unclassified Bradyrhizobium]
MIELLDLKAQHIELEAQLVDAFREVLRAGRFVPADRPVSFEERLAQYCGRRHAVCVANGTAAVQLALIAAGVGEGDEVITVPNTFYATAEAIVHSGASPRFCDVEDATLLMNIEAALAAVTSRTRAIVPVHLFGQVVDVPRLKTALIERGRGDILIVEDCAHAIGATAEEAAVPLGDIGAFSFNPVKNLGSVGDCGGVVTDDDRIAERLFSLRDHARAQKNEHSAIGYNLRPSILAMRVLEIKLQHLSEWNGRRQWIAAQYDRAFSQLHQIAPVQVPTLTTSARHLYVIKCKERNALQSHLKENGVATNIHYPKLIPDQKGMEAIRPLGGEWPVARSALNQILTLPCHPNMRDDDVSRVIECVREFAQR